MKKSVKSKDVIMLLHGLGDNLLLFPVIYDFYLQTKSKPILIVLNNGAKQFWDNINFIDKIYIVKPKTHPRYWNFLMFFLRDYWECLKLTKQVLVSYASYKLYFVKITLLPTLVEIRLLFSHNRHKTTNTYKKLKISAQHQYDKFDLEHFFLTKPDISNLMKLMKVCRLTNMNYIVIHSKTTSPLRNISNKHIIEVAKNFTNKIFIIIMDQNMKKVELKEDGGEIKLPNVFYSTNYDLGIFDLYYLVKWAKCNIVIDSSIMHLCQFTNRPTFAIFKDKHIPKWNAPFGMNIIYKEIYNELQERRDIEQFIKTYS